MRWFVRCALWAIPLAVAGYFVAPTYEHALRSAAFATLGLPPRAPSGSADLSAANALALYAAMALGSRRAPVPRRIMALIGGLFALVLIEFSSGLIGLRSAMLEVTRGPWPPAAERLRDAALDGARWVGVPAIWLLLLGRWELPRGRMGLPGSARPAGPARSKIGIDGNRRRRA
jgi:hypothetical protein